MTQLDATLKGDFKEAKNREVSNWLANQVIEVTAHDGSQANTDEVVPYHERLRRRQIKHRAAGVPRLSIGSGGNRRCYNLGEIRRNGSTRCARPMAGGGRATGGAVGGGRD